MLYLRGLNSFINHARPNYLIVPRPFPDLPSGTAPGRGRRGGVVARRPSGIRKRSRNLSELAARYEKPGRFELKRGF